MDLLHKPIFDYNLLDTIIVFGVLVLGVILFHTIKLGIMILKIHLKNRKD